MANNLKTVFQRLDQAITGNWDSSQIPSQISPSDLGTKSDVIYTTTDKDSFTKTKLEYQQNSYLNQRWLKANHDMSVQAFNGLNNVKLMYRDADLMDSFPEIGAALDIVSEESTCLSPKGQVVTVYSKSDRIKSILEELFVNRLDMHVMAPMIIRGMCKYGNQFMLLNIDNKMGVKGWKQLPVFYMERLENGVENPYMSQRAIDMAKKSDTDMSTKFVWVDENNSQIPFRNWQIGHFRLLTDSLYLPYGSSYLNKARRHWRMLSLMEDMMLIYRLERSIERRIYKIYVGAIDDADVAAYVQEIANNFKRTPIIDPLTGQVDLRKNILQTDADIFIPTRDPNAPTPIDTLPAAQNLTAMDDIKFVQNKVLTALRIPKSFLNFEDSTGDGKNLALMDIRFTRTVNRIQQAFLLELTKIASIHLYLLGFEDDLTNFSLSMTNPSTQAEELEIDNIQKKISVVRDAVADPGNGIPIMSLTRALKEVLKWSDKDIQNNLEEIRLEKALAAELEKTTQIIKKTGIFNSVDYMYGEPGAEYQEDQQPQNQGDAMGGGFGGGSMPTMSDTPMGDEMGEVDELGNLGATEDGEINGNEGEIPMTDNLQGGDNNQQPMESKRRKKPLLKENKSFEEFFLDRFKNKDEIKLERVDIYDKALLINEEFDSLIKSMNEIKKDE